MGPEGVPGATHGALGPWFAAIAATGMIIAAMYLLYMMGRIVWGPLVEPAGHGHHGTEDNHEANLPRDLNIREIGILVPLAALCIFLGVYPKPALDAIQEPIAATLSVVTHGHNTTAQGARPTASASATEAAP
jgi:NADH-quinone oxidoreductase subunit M